MIAGIRHNIGYKILALVLSLALWTDVKLHQEPLTIPMQLRLELRNLPAGVVASTDTAQVTAVLYGPKAYTSRLSAEKVKAFVDLANAVPGQRRDEVKVVLPGALESIINVASVTPKNVDVRIRRKATKTVPVTINWSGTPLVGSEYDVTVLEPRSVEISGSQEVLKTVSRVSASIPNGDQVVSGQFPLVAVDVNGNRVGDAEPSTQFVTIRAVMKSTEGRQQALVSPVYSGTPAPGYKVEGINTMPQAVTIVGPPEAVRALPSVRTRAVDIGGARQDVVKTVQITVPQQVTSNPDTVQVRVRIKASE